MSALPKELIQEIIQENDFKNPGEIMSFLKDAFKDVLQEMLEAEMDLSLGYSRDDSSNKVTDNSRNGYSSKRLNYESYSIRCTQKPLHKASQNRYS